MFAPCPALVVWLARLEPPGPFHLFVRSSGDWTARARRRSSAGRVLWTCTAGSATGLDSQLARLAIGVVVASKRALLSGGRPSETAAGRSRFACGCAARSPARVAAGELRPAERCNHGVRNLIGAAMRRLLLVAVLLVPLAAASPALGKEVLSVTACGSDGCSTSKDAGLLHAMIDVGPPTNAPTRPAKFYRLDITVGAGEEIAGHDRLSWVPSASMLLARDGTWLAVRPEVRSGLNELTRGLDALAAGRVDGFPAAPADAEPPARAPAEAARSAWGDSAIWIVVIAVAALLIGGVLVRGYRIVSRSSGALQSPD